MKKRLGEVAVVGEQQRAAGLEVEASDGKYPFVDVAQEVFDGLAAFGIIQSRDDAARFMQEEVDMALRDQASAVDFHAVFVGIRARSELAHDASVDAYPALCDQMFCRSPRRDAGLREDFLQSLATHVAPSIARRAGARPYKPLRSISGGRS